MEAPQKEIDSVVFGLIAELRALEIPSLFATDSQLSQPQISPIVTKFKLDRIAGDLKRIRQDQRRPKDAVAEAQGLLDERTFVNSEQLLRWTHKWDEKVIQEVRADDDNVNSGPETRHIDELSGGESLNELRQRLLSLKSTGLLDKTNEYHESVQDDILNELSGFAATLKESAMKLSGKIAEDTRVMNSTSENLTKNLGLMGVVDRSLNLYVMNKTGGKISFWFLMKVAFLLFFMFFIMVALVKIFPKM